MFVLLIWVGIYLGAGNVTVSEQLLDGSHIRDPHQFACECMTQDVRVHRPARAAQRCCGDNAVNLPSCE